MRVLCIRTPQVIAADSATTHLCPPLGLASVAAAIARAGHDVTAIDAVGEAPDTATLLRPGFLSYGLPVSVIAARAAAAQPDVIAVSVMFSQDWPVARALMTAVRAACPAARIVAGGEHVSAIPEDCLDACPALDVCVIGEGETTIVEWLSAAGAPETWAAIAGLAFRDAAGVRRTPARARTPVTSLPRPAWSLFPLEPYMSGGLSYGVNRGRTYPLLASRGCPYSCTFCSSPSMWTTKWSARPVEDVLDEMAGAMTEYGATAFDFYDLTAIIRRDWILAFCQGIVARGWRIEWQMPAGTRAEALDREVLEWLARSGHRFLVLAPESGSARTRVTIKKKVDVDRMARLVRDGARLGLDVKLNIIMGYPGETPADLLATLRLMSRFAWLGATDAFAAAFTPYPGSAIFRSLREEGRLPPLDDDYFLSLAGVTSMWRTPSYADAISQRWLTAARVAGMVGFYGLTFLRRPARLVRLGRDLWTGEESSRLSLGLQDLLQRRARLAAATRSRSARA